MASTAVTNVGGLPAGGADNAVLQKQSASSYDADWVTSLTLADGSAAAPAINFSTSTITGLYYDSGLGVSIAVLGNEAFTVDLLSVDIRSSRELRLFNSANTFYIGLNEPTLTANVNLTFPDLDDATLGILNSEDTLTVPTGAGDDDVALSDDVNFYRLNPTGTRTVTGFTGGYGGRVIILANVSAFNIDLAHQSTSSSAANRIITQDGAALTIEPDEVRMLVYDATATRWRTICGCGVNTISPPPPTPTPTPPTPPPPTPPTPPPTPNPTPPTSPPNPPSSGSPPPPGPVSLWPSDLRDGSTGGPGADVFGTDGDGQGLDLI